MRLGIDEPLPDYIGIVEDAQYWNITPTELLNMPMKWVTAGRVVREAKAKAQRAMSKSR